MWHNAMEAERVKALRKAALAERKRLGYPILTGNLALELTIWWSSEEALKNLGDLDNCVTGVFDALQPAHPNTLRGHLAKNFDNWPKSVHPTRAILFMDDSQVVEVVARKAGAKRGIPPIRYEVRITRAT